MKIILLIFTCFFFVSCGNVSPLFSSGTQKTSSITPASPQKYTYEFSTFSCSTGKHNFDTFNQVCEGLTNEDLNQNCAIKKRETLFQTAGCVGDFPQST